MKKNFFTLIYGDKIKAPAKGKIVPAQEFSTLLDAEQVLEHIKQDAERYRSQIIKETEEIKEASFKEGYEDGFQKWSEHLVMLEEQLEKIKLDLQKSIVPVALKAAKKIVARELEISDASIVDIVAATLKTVSQHKKIIIYVNKKDLESLEKNKPQLREVFENLEALSIREREDITPGGCVVETEIGIINAQLEHRWQILEKAFQGLAKKEIAKVENAKET